jgi:hypothetical protein
LGGGNFGIPGEDEAEMMQVPYLGVLEEIPLMLETLVLNNLVMACPLMWVV